MPVAAALMAAAVALAVASPAAAGTDRITFGNVTCAPGWRAPNPGVARFAVANRSGHRATVYLFRAGSGAILGQIRNSKPGSVRHLTVRLRPGSYAWGCALRGFPRHVSDAARVPVHRQLGGTGPAVVPLLSGELAGPLRTYRTYVAARIVALTPQVAALAAAVDSGNLAAAQSAWLTAHLTYLEIGQDDGAYGVFGELGRQIDGTAAGLPNGTADPRFTGFHKLELDLWRRRDLAAARPDAARLSALVAELAHRRLSSELPVNPAGVSTWTLRAHEILEDALRDSLSADDDYGSGTDLAAVTADVAATREVLGLMAPALAPRAPHLVGAARARLTAIDATIAAVHPAGAAWPAITALTLSRRQRINAAVGAALETLAPVPDLLKVGGGS